MLIWSLVVVTWQLLRSCVLLLVLFLSGVGRLAGRLGGILCCRLVVAVVEAVPSIWLFSGLEVWGLVLSWFGWVGLG